MQAVDRSTEPPLGIGRLVLLAWIAFSSLALIGTGDPRPFVRIVGVCSFAVAIVGFLWFKVTRRHLTGGRSVVRVAPRPLDELDGLRRHSDRAANRVLVALDLLRGPLQALLDPTQISAARRAITASLDELATVDRAADTTAAALAELDRSLQGSGIEPSTDPDRQKLQARAEVVRQRQDTIVADLSSAAANLHAAWEPIEQDQLRQLHRQDLAKARNAAEHVIADDPVRADASARLSDAVDEIRARLSGVDEVGTINERILGDS